MYHKRLAAVRNPKPTAMPPLYLGGSYAPAEQNGCVEMTSMNGAATSKGHNCLVQYTGSRSQISFVMKASSSVTSHIMIKTLIPFSQHYM